MFEENIQVVDLKIKSHLCECGKICPNIKAKETILDLIDGLNNIPSIMDTSAKRGMILADVRDVIARFCSNEIAKAVFILEKM